MNIDIRTIAPVTAVLVGIISLVFTIRNSKGNITKRIERKERQIREIESRFVRMYGLNANIRQHYPSSQKIDKLKHDIEDLKKRL